MKPIITLFGLALIFITSCNNSKTTSDNSDTTKLDSVAASSPTSETWIVDPKASEIIWKGTKPTGEHLGTITIKEGSLSTENNKVSAGNFVIDMSTIAETTNADKPKSQDKLVTHLKSKDFFHVDSFPLSNFVITKVEGNTIFGNLTIKNITRGIKFPADIKINGATLNALTGFEIDRTDWEINYNSGKKLKDKIADNVIGDNITYKVSLVAYKQ